MIRIDRDTWHVALGEFIGMAVVRFVRLEMEEGIITMAVGLVFVLAVRPK